MRRANPSDRHISTGRRLLAHGDAKLSATEQRTGADSGSLLTIIGTISSQAALITALLYYFGWVYTYSFYDYFGIDTSLIGYGAPDYVLRSINIAFVPFMYVALCTLALFGFHRYLIAPALTNYSPSPSPPANRFKDHKNDTTSYVTRSRSSQPVRLMIHWQMRPNNRRPVHSSIPRIMNIIQAIAIILAAIVFVGMLFQKQFGIPVGLFMPLFLLVSVSMLGYVAYIRARYANAFAAPTPDRLATPPRAYSLILLALGLVAALWGVSIYGNKVGTRNAAEFAAQLITEPRVVVYSTERIALNGPGIRVDDITQPGTKYRYQYSGVRLLVRAPDKFLLLPARWQHGRDHAIIIRDDSSVRIDIEAT